MVLVITRSDVAKALELDEVIRAVEAAHVELATGTAIQPVRPEVGLPESSVLMIPMVAASGPHNIAGVKLLTDSPDNPANGRPRQQSVILVADPTAGTPEAVIDGALVTRLRTAAASAVATKHLANPDATTLGLVGAGPLAAAHVAAISSVRPIERVVVWSRSSATIRTFIDDVCAGPNGDVTVEVADEPRDVVAAADVLCTVTPSRTPIIEGGWLHAGMHLNVVGAPPRPDHREIDSAVVAACRVVLDSRDVALRESGAVLAALADGAVTAEHVHDELGEVIVGTVPGRRRRSDITLYNSVGIAIQDIVTARVVIDAVRERHLAIHIDLTA